MAFASFFTNDLFAAALSAALERPVVTHEEYQQHKDEPKFEHVETLDTTQLSKLSYAPARGKIGDVFGESGCKITVFLRTITGMTYELEIGCDSYVEEVKHVLEESKGILVDHDRFILMLNGRKLDEGRRISEYGVVDQTTLEFTIDLRASGPTVPLVLESCFRAPSYDFDFSDMVDDGIEFSRGDWIYHRPYGWNRFALNVLGKYENDEWLGIDGMRTESSFGEWPVSYHGTKRDNVKGIAEQGYLLSKGLNMWYGHGIYSSPSIDVAAGYAHSFTHDGDEYEVVFQNRVSPSGLKKVKPSYDTDEYWVQPDQSLIRPYGVCVKRL